MKILAFKHMGVRMMKTAEKDKHWLGIFKSHEQSGLSQQQYCKEHHVSYGTFKYYREKLVLKTRQKNSKQSKTDIFEPVIINRSTFDLETSHVTKIVITLPNKISCELRLNTKGQLDAILQQLVVLC